MDAVEQSVIALEDEPELNAGYGAVLDIHGNLRLDAGIMDGRDGKAAGVAGVWVRHPITLARRVMSNTPHCLLYGRQAMRLAPDMDTLVSSTPEQESRWRQEIESGHFEISSFGRDEFVDTVGAVGLAPDGGLAAASSTGGLFGKMGGRVGDACIPGAGLFASRSCAVVATGLGEMFLERSGCLRTAFLIEDGLDPQAAVEKIVFELSERYSASAGVLAIDAEGRIGAAFHGRSWTVWSSDGPVEPVSL